jgi:hypothetical protein
LFAKVTALFANLAQPVEVTAIIPVRQNHHNHKVGKLRKDHSRKVMRAAALGALRVTDTLSNLPYPDQTVEEVVNDRIWWIFGETTPSECF